MKFLPSDLHLRYSIISDPRNVLSNWNSNDQTPCHWNGVTCESPGTLDAFSRVIGLSLPNSELLGSISADLGVVQHLQSLNLSGNSINGSIPLSLYNVSSLRTLDLSNNLISGELSELVGGLNNLDSLNLSDNALGGKIPINLTTLHNITVVSLKYNYFSGDIPGGFDSVKFLDLSSNLINGSLPSSFGSNNLGYLNLSYNKLSGEIPLQFANKLPVNMTLDLSVNNLTGLIPESSVLYNQSIKAFSGNPELCGKPLKNICSIPSTNSSAPNVTSSTSPPAIAAIPKTIDSSPSSGNGTSKKPETGVKTGTIIGIVVGDVAGIAILAMILIYIYKKRVAKRKKQEAAQDQDFNWATTSSEESKWLKSWACLLNRRNDKQESFDSSSTESEEEEKQQVFDNNAQKPEVPKSSGSLVTVDGGEKNHELELETLLKASAYILGATGSSIMYKAVLEDGTALAVRRIGESGLERFRDFENQVRVIAKLVHPNLVKIRGFYWGVDEKLVIYEFVPNGSLANARYRKVGSSPCALPWEVRLKIAKGMARGLVYIHDKKQVHGNLKPTNVLLDLDMEPKIGDFGLERLVSGDNSYKSSASTRNFGSKRSTASRDSFPEYIGGATPSPSPSSMGCSPYYAPESLRSLKPTSKWDVYSFGVVLLELLTGKVIISDEFGPDAIIGSGSAMLEKNKILRMADMALRADMEGKEESLLALLRLGYNCISPLPQKRPSMKEALHILDKFPLSSSPSSYYYGH
ncbi:putative LRR receptor-like serine/threonine-protein kinase [Heracleum sosnowskyi]|uniref:non-specific serine/threonine protein kinase n=1 Tax=Heracleum sosnowskyi TaxID=360622 RepID=A0AAD8M992_9APIA|nr:putative LRR receptor-like serine/threonine-protein kinase [Heracleum sosnowskyi]